MSEMIEQLSFGKSVPKLNSCIGIYLSPEVVFISEVHMSGAKPVVDHLVRVPIPAAAAAAKETKVEGILNTESLTDTERIFGLVRQAMSQIRWRSEYAMITLSPHFGILRYFTMPSVDMKYWKMAIPAEAKKYIPIPFDDLVHDFQVWNLPPGPDKRGRLGALFGVTHRKNLASIMDVAGKLGLKLVGTELAACSVERLWDLIERESAPYAQVHFDGGNVRILLSENNLPIFVREVALGAEAKVADKRKVDLNGCVDFVRKQLGAARPAKVRVSGTTPEMAEWKESFAVEVGLPVSIQDTAKALGIKAGEWGGYASIGCALRHMTATALAVDISQSGRADETDRRVAADVFKVSGAAAAVLLSVAIVYSALAGVKGAELARLSGKGGTLAAFQGKSTAAIQEMLRDMQARANSIGSLAVGEARLTHILEDVAQDVPDPVWISALEFQDPMLALLDPSMAASSRQLTLTGNSVGLNETVEQDQVLQFKHALVKDERFSKAFPAVEVAVRGSAMRAEAVQVGSPDQVAAQQETRTSFTMTCGPGKHNG